MSDRKTIDNRILLEEIRLHLSHGKDVRLRAKGNSMAPFIHGNDDILVLSPPGNLRKGDIVLAHTEDKGYVIHRIIKISNEHITLMGDSNMYEKEECCLSDIYGRARSTIRDGKEYSLISSRARLLATAWRFILPLRRMKIKISNVKNKI